MMMTWWSGMSINSVLTVHKYVGSFKQCWVLLQAAQCDNCNSVTASFTSQQCSCSAHNNSVTASFTSQQCSCSAHNNSVTASFTSQQCSCSAHNNSVTASFTSQQRSCSAHNNSVTASFTSQQRSCSAPNNPRPLLHFEVTIFGTVMWRHSFSQTLISSIVADVTSMECCTERPLRNLTKT